MHRSHALLIAVTLVASSCHPAMMYSPHHFDVNSSPIAVRYNNGMAADALSTVDAKASDPRLALGHGALNAALGLARVIEGEKLLADAKQRGAWPADGKYQVFSDAHGAAGSDVVADSTACYIPQCQYQDLTAAQLEAGLAQLHTRLDAKARQLHDQFTAAVRRDLPNVTPAQLDKIMKAGMPEERSAIAQVRQNYIVTGGDPAECWFWNAEVACWSSDGSLIAGVELKSKDKKKHHGHAKGFGAESGASGSDNASSTGGDAGCVQVDVESYSTCTYEQWNDSHTPPSWETATSSCWPAGTKFRVCRSGGGACKTYVARTGTLTLGDC